MEEIKINMNKNEDWLIDNTINQELDVDNNKDQTWDDSLIQKTFVTIKKEPTQSNLVVEDGKKDEVVVIKKADQDLFVNYDSDFHKNEKSIMQKIRLFKMTPKTRTWFILVLIFLTVWIIALMMQLDPENQSFSNYKASLLEIVWRKTETKIKVTSLQNTWVINEQASTWVTNTWVINEQASTWVTNTWVINEQASTWVTNTWVINEQTSTWVTNTWVINEQTSTWVTNTWIIEEETLIKEKWLTVKPDIIVKEDGSTEYMYKWQTFSKEWLQEELKKDVKAEIDKKTKDYLNKLYIEN